MYNCIVANDFADEPPGTTCARCKKPLADSTPDGTFKLIGTGDSYPRILFYLAVIFDSNYNILPY